jgi:hypothetical protein
MEELIRDMYALKRGSAQSYPTLDPQRLALLFIILAIGSLHNLELPPNDPSADEYLDLAKRSLTKSDFMTNCTIAGIQTLVSYRSQVTTNVVACHGPLPLVGNAIHPRDPLIVFRATEKGRNGDSAWPLWGLAMRLLQAVSRDFRSC